MIMLRSLVLRGCSISSILRPAGRLGRRWAKRRVRQGERMRIDRTVAVAALLGAMAVGFAGPAWAEDLTPGKYTVIREAARLRLRWRPETRLRCGPSIACGSDCAQVIGDNAVTWDVHLADGRWTGSVKRPDAVDCKNGTAAPGTSELSLDAVTLRGTVVSTSDGPACGSPAPITGGPVYIAMDQA